MRLDVIVPSDVCNSDGSRSTSNTCFYVVAQIALLIEQQDDNNNNNNNDMGIVCNRLELAATNVAKDIMTNKNNNAAGSSPYIEDWYVRAIALLASIGIDRRG